MPTYLALLRAINLGSHKPLPMARLKTFAGELGLSEPQTLLQTGNLVFQHKASTPAKLELLLHSEAKTRLGLDTDFFVRTIKDWQSIIKGNPFPAEAKSDPSHLLVLFLKDKPPASSLAALRSSITGRERVELAGRHAYFTYPDGIGRSRLTGKLIESKLQTRTTGRNWNTVLKLAALAQSS